MWKIILYTATGIIFTKTAHLFYEFLKNKSASEKEKRLQSAEVTEVIWTNELAQVCLSNHYSYQNGFSLEPRGQNKCKNPYCAATNISRIIEYIDNAKYTIDLAMYTFTSTDLSNALCRALRRDVIVRIITDQEMNFSSGSQVLSLTKSGAPVRFPLSTSLMHHKFCIIDGVNRVSRIMENDKKEFDANSVKSLLFNGSLNWTLHGFKGNWENVLITSNKSLVKKFEEEFERMWIAFDIQDTNDNS